MTETNFTPGPWEARYSSVIDVEKDEIIAVMTCGSVYRKNEIEDYDTARFIAAAPRMYAALDAMANGEGLPPGETIERILSDARGEYMSQVHTIVVRFADGVVPRYSAATEFQGGQVVAVDFDGNRLRIAQELEEALDQAMTSMLDSGYSKGSAAIRAGMAALAKARGES